MAVGRIWNYFWGVLITALSLTQHLQKSWWISLRNNWFWYCLEFRIISADHWKHILTEFLYFSFYRLRTNSGIIIFLVLELNQKSCLPRSAVLIIGHLWNGWKKIYCVVLQGGYDPVMHAGEYCLGASFQHRVPPKCLIQSAHMMIILYFSQILSSTRCLKRIYNFPCQIHLWLGDVK